MTTFVEFRGLVSKQLIKMEAQGLLKTLATKEQLRETYLNSFPEGTNPLHITNTVHDCTCCKQFLSNIGGVVAIIDGKLETPWNIKIGGHFQVVADALNELVLNSDIQSIYLNESKLVGNKNNLALLESGDTKQYDHFYHNLKPAHVRSKHLIATEVGKFRTSFYTLKRSVTGLTEGSVEVILDLISQGSLYRGDEFKSSVQTLQNLQKDYKQSDNSDLILWKGLLDKTTNNVALRNSVIGTLLEHLSEGKDLEYSVRSFEEKVAPQNYKRTTALVSKSMIEGANKKVTVLGLEASLPRRYANESDLTINNVLYADRSSKIQGNIFEELISSVPDKVPSLDKMEEVAIKDFIKDILPKADKLEVMFDNKHVNNLVSLVAPINEDSKPILKWDNNFSWSYNGEVTDSIKEKVKAAGGSVTGALRCSLGWYNEDDLDISITEPSGNSINFSKQLSGFTGGNLDIDMNAGGRNNAVDPVENITYPTKSKIPEGVFTLVVHNYNKRNGDSNKQGFTVEVEFEGKVLNFNYTKTVSNNERITVVKFNYSKTKGLTILESIPSTATTKEVWNINTTKLQEVSMVMNSPNHWDDQEVGNKHLFFMLKDCINPDDTRGFYNEFLCSELHEHRKVFELLSSKLKAPHTDNQLSGLGFSTTLRNELVCKVSGSFNRFVKIKF